MNGTEFDLMRKWLVCESCGHGFEHHGVDRDSNETICWVSECQCSDYRPTPNGEAPTDWYKS